MKHLCVNQYYNLKFVTPILRYFLFYFKSYYKWNINLAFNNMYWDSFWKNYNNNDQQFNMHAFLIKFSFFILSQI